MYNKRLAIIVFSISIILLPCVFAAENTSLYAVRHVDPGFTFASATYVPETSLFFNTSMATTQMIMLFSANVKRQTGTGTSEVWARINVDGAALFEDMMRTVTGGGAFGCALIRPFLFNISAGEHNITLEFRRTGTGTINITNIDMALLKFKTTHDDIVRGQLINNSYMHSSASFSSAFNWTINKTIASDTFIMVKQSVSSTAAANATYYIGDLSTGLASQYWISRILNAADTNNLMATYIEFEETAQHNHTIKSKTTAGTVTVNFSIMDMDLIDNSSNPIGHFQLHNNLTNLTSAISFSAGTHNILNTTVLVNNGTGYLLAMTASLSSTSGAQTPVFFVNASNVSESYCYSRKEARLSSNTDIDMVHAIFICSNLTAGNNYTFSMWAEVEAGETLILHEESFNGFE
ncbi:MAG: hypothetical protein WC852_06340, partial [Candidatus Nanoarchaeia archaeon]